MNYDQKREMRRRVRTRMLPSPRWELWNAIPECRTSCPLYVDGSCAWDKRKVEPDAPCVPVIAVCLRALDKARDRR